MDNSVLGMIDMVFSILKWEVLPGISLFMVVTWLWAIGFVWWVVMSLTDRID